MKLRTTGRSIRLRLSQTDVRDFAETGVVEETLVISAEENQQFGYRLVKADTRVASASFQEGILTISVPTRIADDWTSTDQVGIEATYDNGTAEGLTILIEKDFACITPRTGEDDLDTFPHPAAATSS